MTRSPGEKMSFKTDFVLWSIYLYGPQHKVSSSLILKDIPPRGTGQSQCGQMLQLYKLWQRNIIYITCNLNNSSLVMCTHAFDYPSHTHTHTIPGPQPSPTRQYLSPPTSFFSNSSGSNSHGQKCQPVRTGPAPSYTSHGKTNSQGKIWLQISECRTPWSVYQCWPFTR